ncbi:MAG: hypothetical protein HOP08_03405 [Cyclobacteriaceae bacterium]|nr:hypothetical protein [Cyclobacteriaceae bacterium]
MKNKIILIITIGFIITAGILIFRSNTRRYVSDESFQNNIIKQKELNGRVLALLHENGIKEDSLLKAELRFYTDDQDKANNLVAGLRKLNYTVDTYNKSDEDQVLWEVSGWSTLIQINSTAVTQWTDLMCKTGFDNDCEFDGWWYKIKDTK